MTVLEEYCVAGPDGRLNRYAGNRVIELPPGCKEGAQHGETLSLSEPVEIGKGWANRKTRWLAAGTKVWRWRTGLGLKPKSQETLANPPQNSSK